MSLGAMLVSLFGHLRPYRRQLLLVVLGSLLDMGFNAQLSVSFKLLIDRAIGRHDQQALILIVAGLAAAALVVSITGPARDRLYCKVAGSLMADLRAHIFLHLERLGDDYYARTDSAAIHARFTGDLGGTEKALLSAVDLCLTPGLNVLFSALLIFALDWRLALIAMLACPVAFLGPTLLAGRTTAARAEHRAQELGMAGLVDEHIAAQRVVKAFNLQQRAFSLFHDRCQRYRDAMVRFGFLSLVWERSSVLSTQVLQIAILGVGAWMAFRGRLSVGTLAAFQGLFIALSSSLARLAQYVQLLLLARSGMRRVNELLCEKPAVVDTPDAEPLPAFSQAIDFRDVEFGYVSDHRVLHGISFTIPRGTSAAFVGSSGCGKSTVLGMIMRFHDPASGSVLYDGRDLQRATLESLRGRVAMVFQDSFLFNTSLRENLAIGRLGATDDEIVEAARQAEIHEPIQHLPRRYDAVVGDRGGRLSRGQRQRLAIARALLRNPDILLLDEATSSLDAASEAAISSTIHKISGGRTVIWATHRLATVTRLDRIFVLDKGRLVEQGTHPELLALNGVYAALWNKQKGFSITADGDHAAVDPVRLRAIPLLAPLDDAPLARLAKAFVTERFPAGRLLVQEGDPGDKFYILARGTVEVVKAGAEGEPERRVAVLQDGDFFGEVALLRSAPRNASVRALAECVCLTLARGQFIDFLSEMPALRETILGIAAARA
jgi:ATP-binding cassette, subfamily B, bacterial